MSVRNRTSNRGPGAAAHEESQIWAETFNILKQLPDMHVRAQKLAGEANKSQKILLGLSNGEGIQPHLTGLRDDKLIVIEASAELLGKLEGIYQEGVRIAEQEASILEKAKEQLGVLAALRTATETHSEQKRKRKDAPTDAQPSKTKKAKTYPPPPKEAQESDEIKVGSQVAFHLPKAKQSDAEWIQCDVIRITGEYPKLRYEVKDPEPDEHGNASQTYKTNAQSIILIPDDSVGLPPLPPGTMVLARYPETTTFYKAEVIATKVTPLVDVGFLRVLTLCQRDGTCKLRFEGEEEIGKETDVERRLVLEV